MNKILRKVGMYAVNILVSLDQLGNTVLGGDPDETLSSRMGKARERCPVCYWVCRALHMIDPGHCQDAIEPDEGDRDVIR